MNKEMENLFWELKQYLVQHSPKWDTLCNIEQYIIDLQHQLEEKDKVIDEAIKYMDMVAEIGSYSNSKSLYGEDFDELYEILERGKNEKS